MKKSAFLITALLAGCLSASGQGQKDSSSGRITKNGVPVTYNNHTAKEEKSPAYFINGEHITGFPGAMDPQKIKSIYVKKDRITAAGKKYNGAIYIEMKPDTAFHFISLADLVKKYTDLVTTPVVFTVNGSLINSDYDQYMIDETTLLNITVQDFVATREKNIKLIQVATNTAENIKKSKEIWIRGNEVAQTDVFSFLNKETVSKSMRR